MATLKQIEASQFGLPDLEMMASRIAERTLFDHGGLRVSLFFIPKGKTMPLHDHPGMIVIAYVLQG
jgi:quercetin dioxygenase-like cupin family protein